MKSAMLIAIRKEPKTMHKTSPVEPGKATQRIPVAIVKIAIKMLSHLTFLKKLFNYSIFFLLLIRYDTTFKNLVKKFCRC